MLSFGDLVTPGRGFDRQLRRFYYKWGGQGVNSSYRYVLVRRRMQDYTSVAKGDLRQFLLARLRIFYEEELDVPLVL